MEKVNVTASEEVTEREKIVNEQEVKSKINQISKFIYIINFISLISFSALLIFGWLSLFWLHKYHFVFTFYRFVKDQSLSLSQNYFPIQLSSLFLYLFIILILLSITITYIFFIRTILRFKNFDFLNDKNKNYIIPIMLNLFLFYIGELTHNKTDIFHIYYFLGFISTIISLFYLIKLFYDFDYENEYLDFNNYINNTIVYDFFYGALISLDLYYLFYVSCQIVFYFMDNNDIKIFMGIIVNFCMGIVAIYIGYKLKNMIIAFLFGIIYNGIIIFHFSFTENERKEINLNNFEIVLSGMFIAGFIILLIYIFHYKRNKIFYL